MLTNSPLLKMISRKSVCVLALFTYFFAASGARAQNFWSNPEEARELSRTTPDPIIDLRAGPDGSPLLIPSFSLVWGISWSGQKPYVKNDRLLMAPASVEKLITAATSLRVLGPDFRFVNEFEGKVFEEQDVETLVEPGFTLSSDPTWGHPSYEGFTERFQKVAQALKENSITKVVGPISFAYLRPQIAEHARPSDWKKAWNLACYATLPTKIILNGNCATFRVSANRTAAWTTPGVSTALEMRVNRASFTSLQVTPVFDSLGRVLKYLISGSISQSTTFTVPVHHNESWFKNLFIAELKKAGVAYLPKLNATDEAGLRAREKQKRISIDLSSPALSDILPGFLQESINLVGDRLFLENGYQTNSVVLAEAEKQTIRQFVRDSEIDLSTLVIKDGSGLNPADRMTAQIMQLFLGGAIRQPYFDELLQAMAVAGVSGTVRNRMTGPLTKGRVFAKTGTLARIANLAGYFKKSDGLFEPFAIFTESDLAASEVRLKTDTLVTQFAAENSPENSVEN